MAMTILVTGATGNVGRELVAVLAQAGGPVRALLRRDEDRARLPDGVEAALGDLNRPESVRGALEGVSGVHLLAGYAELPALLAEARGAGVERVVCPSKRCASRASPGRSSSRTAS